LEISAVAAAAVTPPPSRSTSEGMPVAFSGLSDGFTAGRPSTGVTLQTIEIGSRSADPSGAQARTIAVEIELK
jgi:hypothetical protein